MLYRAKIHLVQLVNLENVRASTGPGPPTAGPCPALILTYAQKMHQGIWCKYGFNCIYVYSNNNFEAKILEEVVAYAKLFPQHIGYQIMVTGSAASEIGGVTAAKEFNLNGQRQEALVDDIHNFVET